MTAKTYFWVTLLGGWLGLHKFMTGKAGMGVLYLLTGGLCGIGWLIDIIIAASNLPKSKSNTVTNPYTTEPNQQFAYNSTARFYIDKYYKGMEEIETMWSVMYNLKIVNGEQADIFESKCRENIADLYQMLDVSKRCKYDSTMPPHVPSYVRLAMLYEKQERYADAIDICVEAIKAGAIDDGNKGKMYGRLARMIRKSGITVNDEVLALSMKS